MKSSRKIKMSVGVSSMLMIFVVLCLTTFAVLSFVTANADARLTDKAVQAASRYYEADNKAEQMIAVLDELAQNARTNARQFVDGGIPVMVENSDLKQQLSGLDRTAQGTYERAFFFILQSKAVELVDLRMDGETALASFQISAGESQRMEVELRLPADATAGRYEVTSRRWIGTQDVWNEDQPLDLWRGES